MLFKAHSSSPCGARCEGIHMEKTPGVPKVGRQDARNGVFCWCHFKPVQPWRSVKPTARLGPKLGKAPKLAMSWVGPFSIL